MKSVQYIGNKMFNVIEQEKSTPLDAEVRIKVAYCGICGTDVHIYHGSMDKRVNIPQVIGHEMSGEIDAVGQGVTGFSVGDKIVVRPLDNRGEDASDKGYSHICKKLKFVGIDSEGAMQQYWNVHSFILHKLPKEIDLKLASLIEPIAVACHDVRMSLLKKGEYAVVLGGGPIGILVAIIAKELGAKVLISEVNPIRIKLAREMGFDVVNSLEVDLIKYVEDWTNGCLADVVFEVAGVQPALDVMTEIAGLRGRIVCVAIHSTPKLVNLHKFFWRELTLIGARVYEAKDYEQAIMLVNESKLPFEKLITGVYPLVEVNELFKEIESNPSGMKYLIDCQL